MEHLKLFWFFPKEIVAVSWLGNYWSFSNNQLFILHLPLFNFILLTNTGHHSSFRLCNSGQDGHVSCSSEFFSSWTPHCPEPRHGMESVRAPVLILHHAWIPCSMMENSLSWGSWFPFQGNSSYWSVISFNKNGELEGAVNIHGD